MNPEISLINALLIIVLYYIIYLICLQKRSSATIVIEIIRAMPSISAQAVGSMLGLNALTPERRENNYIVTG
jgi:hypothetical protein